MANIEEFAQLINSENYTAVKQLIVDNHANIEWLNLVTDFITSVTDDASLAYGDVYVRKVNTDTLLEHKTKYYSLVEIENIAYGIK
jgi:hypothetical protein